MLTWRTYWRSRETQLVVGLLGRADRRRMAGAPHAGAVPVTRGKGTERPFSSEMCSSFEPGLYACLCCDTPLFDSEEKFESGTGWPSFTQPVDPAAVAYHVDGSLGMSRVETICNTCDAHLGHVFLTGLRRADSVLHQRGISAEGREGAVKRIWLVVLVSALAVIPLAPRLSTPRLARRSRRPRTGCSPSSTSRPPGSSRAITRSSTSAS